MGKKRVTAKDVAEMAGVSRSTVSMILNNYQHVSFPEETKMRVLAACDALGYRTFGNGRLDSVAGRLLLILCPSFHNAYYIMVDSVIQERARELGYTPLTFCTSRNEEEENNAIRLCRELHVAGVILTYQPKNSFLVQLISMETQMVQLYDKASNSNVDAIEQDNYKIGQLVAEHLLSLGHTHIAHVSKPLNGSQPARIRRIEGIRAYMAAHGLDPEEHLRVSTVETEGLQAGNLEGYDTGYLLAGHLVDMGIPVTAFAATNDTVAYGIMDAVLERGKRIPQDYSVCGCDNLRESSFQRIALTTVEPYTREKARNAMDLLVSRIQNRGGKKNGPVSITRIEYPPQIIVRKSTGKR